MSIGHALASVAGKVRAVRTYRNGKWFMYVPGSPLSDLTKTEPGAGYRIFLVPKPEFGNEGKNPSRPL